VFCPNATETKIFYTANARALRHLLEMRASPMPNEIACSAVEVLRICSKKPPTSAADYTLVPWGRNV